MFDLLSQSVFLLQDGAWWSGELLAFSVVDWFSDGWYELKQYAGHMGKKQWMVLSGLTVAFGMMCMRGFSIKG
ncbi:MAG: hypothetical protein AAGJ40_17565 [Planctomycetota bacterium]